MRKIIQIAASEDRNEKRLYALDNLGAVWEHFEGEWHQLPGVPEPEVKVNDADKAKWRKNLRAGFLNV